jgi:aryl-alcohol dehydrogenase-like predicted oxidoreductase
MFTRPLGRSGIEVTALGMGCWAIGKARWGDVKDENSIAALHRAVELGVNFFDTADVYGDGHSESLLSKIIKGRRDKLVIASKFGNGFDAATQKTLALDDIRRACHASLERLETDYIDLYQFHLNDYPLENADRIRDALETLVQEGKIRAYGWSTDSLESAKFFARGEHCAAVQFQTNVIDYNKPMQEMCERENIAAILRGPLAMGLLTGKYDLDSVFPENDIRGPNAPKAVQYFKEGRPNPEWLSRLEAVRDILTSNGRAVAQGAIAWHWAVSKVTIPIPGFKTPEQVEQNFGAIEFGALEASQVAEIESILGR